MIAALDLTIGGRLHFRFRDRDRWREFLAFRKTLRRRWPAQRLYLILDDFPAQAPRRPRVVRRRSLLRTQQHRPPHPPRAGRRPRRLHPLAQPTARPQTGFATGSKIRHPDYPFKTARRGIDRDAPVNATEMKDRG